MATKTDKLSTHKKKAWDAFSIYIRTRDAILTTGTLDECVCVSCPRRLPTRGVLNCIQAGHFIGGRTNAVLFQERGVHGQCPTCNNGFRGRSNKLATVRYYQFMLKTYGQDVIDELIFESNQIVKYKPWEFDEIAERYRVKTEELIRAYKSGLDKAKALLL